VTWKNVIYAGVETGGISATGNSLASPIKMTSHINCHSKEPALKNITLRELRSMKDQAVPITGCTAYDYAGIRVAEDAGMDLLIPDDWGIGTTLQADASSLVVRMEDILFYLKGLVRNSTSAFILAPMPFGSYIKSNEDTIRNATRLMKEGAEAVVLQGGGITIEQVQALAEVGVPVFGYLGYTPHRVNQLGGERAFGLSSTEAGQILNDALALEKAGAFGVILHHVTERVTKAVTEKTNLITLGMGETRGADGYIALFHDIIGWPQYVKPKLSIDYGNFTADAREALDRHVDEVQALEFPTEKNTFKIADEEFGMFLKEIS
jgi:3-methyl-2-oxobutanoate hydroxymethyltransferase